MFAVARQLTSPSVVSVGYEGSTVDELVGKLKANDVRVLVDVRLTPLSRKPGLSKRRLAVALEQAGIGYVNEPALGNPRANRAGLRAGDPHSRAKFEKILRNDDASKAIAAVVELMSGGVVALLCFERQHAECHRSIVAQKLQTQFPQLSVVEV